MSPITAPIGIPDDYIEQEFELLRVSLPGMPEIPKPDPDTLPNRIFNLDGVPWHKAPRPPRRHKCWPQTIGLMDYGATIVHRCPCEAIRMSPYLRENDWMERNVRKPKPGEVLPPPPWVLYAALTLFTVAFLVLVAVLS